jgi:hypothetical protein
MLLIIVSISLLLVVFQKSSEETWKSVDKYRFLI